MFKSIREQTEHILLVLFLCILGGGLLAFVLVLEHYFHFVLVKVLPHMKIKKNIMEKTLNMLATFACLFLLAMLGLFTVYLLA